MSAIATVDTAALDHCEYEHGSVSERDSVTGTLIVEADDPGRGDATSGDGGDATSGDGSRGDSGDGNDGD